MQLRQYCNLGIQRLQQVSESLEFAGDRSERVRLLKQTLIDGALDLGSCVGSYAVAQEALIEAYKRCSNEESRR